MSKEMDSMSDTEKNSEQLNLKVIGQDGQTVQFKIKRSTPFRKVRYIHFISIIRLIPQLDIALHLIIFLIIIKHLYDLLVVNKRIL